MNQICNDWQSILKSSVKTLQQLADELGISLKINQPIHFPLRVTQSFVDRMERGNPQDPLLLQVLPQTIENISTPGFELDPLREQKLNPISGLIHKYQSRVLVTLTQACAVHCRYCFRQHFSYHENTPGKAGFTQIIDYVTADKHISEVILSGGDPLMAKDHLILDFASQLQKISHVKTLRFHSRLPIVLTERISDSLLDCLDQIYLKKVMVTHCNHPNEINDDVMAACARLQQHGVTLLNQTVLLKNINNDASTLIRLSEKLFDCGILPYYLHLPDKVEGTAHFDVSEQEARHIMKTVTAKLAGYLVPKLVREIPGRPSKTLINLIT